MKKTLNEEIDEIKGMMGKLDEMPAYVLGADGPRDMQPDDKLSAFSAEDFGHEDNTEDNSQEDKHSGPLHKDELGKAVGYYTVAEELKKLGHIEDAKKYARMGQQIFNNDRWNPFTNDELNNEM